MPNHAPVTRRDVLRGGASGTPRARDDAPHLTGGFNVYPREVEDELLRLPGIRARLANFKGPKAICRIDELPRNAMGKIDKPQLRARLGS